MGGSCLSAGYIGQSASEVSRFIQHPFEQNATSKIFKTGDRGRWLSDGSVEYRGRVDDQVKIRGYRIELGEIEHVMETSEMTERSVVIPWTEADGHKRLVAYVILRDQFTTEEIKTYLKAKLPEYMVPSAVVALAEFKFTASGKVDKRSFPHPNAVEHQPQTFAAATTPTEKKIADVWKNLLKVNQVDIDSDFFELGGHSLLAMRVVIAIRNAFDLEIEITDLFSHSTVRDLSAFVDAQSTGNKSKQVIPVLPRTEKIPLSFSQERLWFIDQLGGSEAYHIPAIIRVTDRWIYPLWNLLFAKL